MILGGTTNVAGDPDSDDPTIGMQSIVSGGKGNVTSGRYASVSGGQTNTASGENSSVSGGYENTANGHASSVSGGANRSVSYGFDWRAGNLFEEQ